MDLSDFKVKPTWALAEGTGKGRLEVKHYLCCPEPYPRMSYNVTLKERDAFDNDDDIIKILKNHV